MAVIDFAAEGLLDGVEGDARQARLALLEQLAGEGVPLEELREAVAAGRLTLLPVERGIAGTGPRYTRGEVAELSGADLGLLQRASAALGIPYPEPDERVLTEADLEAARRVKAFLEAGLPEDGIIQVARTIGKEVEALTVELRATPSVILPSVSPPPPSTCCRSSSRPCSTPSGRTCWSRSAAT